MNPQTLQTLQILLPIVIVLPLLYFRMRRMSKPQPLKWKYLLVRPALFVGLAAFVMAQAPPLRADWPWLGVALMLGAAAGWHFGRSMAIQMHPEKGTLMVKGNQAAMLLLVVLIVLRQALRTGLQIEAPVWHVRVALITDISIVFSAALLAVQGLEMFLRARRMIGQKTAGSHS